VARVSHIARQTLGFYREHAGWRVLLPCRSLLLTRSRSTSRGAPLQGSKVNWQAGIDPGEDRFCARGELIAGVISNLIANAIYAMPGGGGERSRYRAQDLEMREGEVFVDDRGHGEVGYTVGQNAEDLRCVSLQLAAP